MDTICCGTACGDGIDLKALTAKPPERDSHFKENYERKQACPLLVEGVRKSLKRRFPQEFFISLTVRRQEALQKAECWQQFFDCIWLSGPLWACNSLAWSWLNIGNDVAVREMKDGLAHVIAVR